jgi:hypothetical protein
MFNAIEFIYTYIYEQVEEGFFQFLLLKCRHVNSALIKMPLNLDLLSLFLLSFRPVLLGFSVVILVNGRAANAGRHGRKSKIE